MIVPCVRLTNPLTVRQVRCSLPSDQPFSDPLPAAYQTDMQKIFTLYRALDSPFGMGNETFGAGAYKRAAAIIGNSAFRAPARLWFESAAHTSI